MNKEEWLSYSAGRLVEVFDKVFSLTGEEDGLVKASDYARNSTKLGNFIYANKNGNGNEASGDGYKFRGRGLFQLTGRENYQKFTTFYNERFNTDLNFETNPATVASNTKISVISALWYYEKRVLSKIQINSTTSISDVTKKINSKKQGLNKRKVKTNQAKNNIADCIEFSVN